MDVYTTIKEDLTKYFIENNISDAEQGVQQLCSLLTPQVSASNYLTITVPKYIHAWTALQILQSSNKRVYLTDKDNYFIYDKSQSIILYHGTNNRDTIPSTDYNNDWCDFGKGFYLSPDKQIAEEWACSRADADEEKTDPYVQTYLLDLSDLTVFNFEQYNPEYYIAEVLKHNTADTKSINKFNKDTFINSHSINIDIYDIIIGYRMDSTYESILFNSVYSNFTSKLMNDAIHLGNLGIQYCIRTPIAYSKLHRIFCDGYPVTDYNSKLDDYNIRIKKANILLQQMEVK